MREEVPKSLDSDVDPDLVSVAKTVGDRPCGRRDRNADLLDLVDVDTIAKGALREPHDAQRRVVHLGLARLAANRKPDLEWILRGQLGEPQRL